MQNNRLLVVVAMITMILAGCSTVEPWRRGTLAKTEMQWSPDPMDQGLRNHIYFSKEGSSGGATVGGGGCGCN